MRTGKTKVTKLSLAGVALSVLAVLASCGLPLGIDSRESKSPEMFRATREAEAYLTAAHGVEARELVENYESRWLSLAAYQDPSIQSELASGRYLDYRGLGGLDLASGSPWLVTTSAFARSVTVLEHSGQRIKATACVILEGVETLPNGESPEPVPPYERCGVYVFARESGIWKLVGYFNLLQRRDWEYTPPWLKEIIGDLPETDP